MNTLLALFALASSPVVDPVEPTALERRTYMEQSGRVIYRNGVIIPVMLGLEILGFIGLIVAFRNVKNAREADMKQILIDREQAKTDRAHSAVREVRMDAMAADIAAALAYLRAHANLSGIAVEDNSKKLECLKKQIDGNTASIIESHGHTPTEIVLPTMNVVAETVTVTQAGAAP